MPSGARAGISIRHCRTWDVNKVTAELTRFADACVSSALRFLLAAQAAQAGSDPVAEGACGLTVLAMGKYGAFELNYSSDIDLVVFYDAGKFPFAKRGDPRSAAVDIVRGLVKLCPKITSDVMCFASIYAAPRCGATQVAISTDAAWTITSHGQNWERAAMIKRSAWVRRSADRRAIPFRSSAFHLAAYLDFPPSRIFSTSSGKSTPMSVRARSRSPAPISSWDRGGIARSNFSPRPSN